MYKRHREQAQEGLPEEAVLEGCEGSSHGEECSRQQEQHVLRPWLGRNLVLAMVGIFGKQEREGGGGVRRSIDREQAGIERWLSC